MAIAIPTLALMVVLLALPNYVAFRYALFGGSPVASVTAGAVAGSGKPSRLAAAPAGKRRGRLAALTQRAYGWKMLSPFLFATCVILALGIGGIVGIVLVSLALLNVVWGALGWSAYDPGRK